MTIERDPQHPTDRPDGVASRYAERLAPEDEGIGSVRPEEMEPLAPNDEGIGSVRPDEIRP